MPAELVEDIRSAGPVRFEVWPENMPIVDLFLSIESQWRTNTLADGRLYFHGLDYTAAQAGFALAGRAVAPADWAGVQVMERAAAAALNGG